MNDEAKKLMCKIKQQECQRKKLNTGYEGWCGWVISEAAAAQGTRGQGVGREICGPPRGKLSRSRTPAINTQASTLWVGVIGSKSKQWLWGKN